MVVDEVVSDSSFEITDVTIDIFHCRFGFPPGKTSGCFHYQYHLPPLTTTIHHSPIAGCKSSASSKKHTNAHHSNKTSRTYTFYTMASGGDPFAWLGLLKWSLSYADGTSESKASPMTPQDRAFLESVMKEGIIDENERMKTILKQVTEKIEEWTLQGVTADAISPQVQDEMQILLQEVRDIVEQIDYARAFCAMKGLPFLLGCVQERTVIPRSMRLSCLGILATMSQQNPPVQKELLELSAIRVLSDLFFLEQEQRQETDVDGQLRARIIQAVSANVKSHDLAEAVFCQLDQAPLLLALGLTGSSNDGNNGNDADDKIPVPVALRQRTLFFLKALLTSDSATRERIQRFNPCLALVLDGDMMSDELSSDIREMALELVQLVLEQKKSVNLLLDRKGSVASAGVQRVSALRSLEGEEREYAAVELELWEKVLILLARATPDEEAPAADALLLSTTDEPTLAQ